MLEFGWENSYLLLGHILLQGLLQLQRPELLQAALVIHFHSIHFNSIPRKNNTKIDSKNSIIIDEFIEGIG